MSLVDREFARSSASTARRELRGRRPEKAWLALLLAWTAGVVDSVGYVLLAHVFTAHMSGNSAAMGVYAGAHNWLRFVARGLPVPVFVFAVFLGGLLMEGAAALGVRRRLALQMAVELALLSAFLVWVTAAGPSALVRGWDVASFGLTALLVAAMGIQSSALQSVGGRTIRTTFVTGMLTNLANELATLAAGRWRRHRPPPGARRGSAARARLFALLWGSFAAGAVVGGFAEPHWGEWALLPAVSTILVVVGIDIRSPLYPSRG